MASSGGGDVPADRAAAAVNDVVVARRGVETLKSFLLQLGDHRVPWAELVADDVLNRLSDATSKLGGAAGAATGGRSPAAPSSDRARPERSGSSRGNTRKRSFSRRSQRAFDQRIMTTLELDDGHIWRKYGQKDIQNSPHPRSYFRCTHKSDQGCNAKRYVQVCETDPSKRVVTYYGEHTCRDPSENPIVIHAAGAGSGNLISFAAASRTNARAPSSQMATDGSANTQPSTSWCTSDDVFSSTPGSFMHVVGELGAVVGSAAVMSARTPPAGSAPDSGDVKTTGTGGGGAGSFPSSPNSLGFEVGDDDFFRLDLDDP